VGDRFLFAFDGATDNHRYRDFARERGFEVFAGRELRLGPSPGWKPDCMRVVAEDRRYTLAIVELEADANAARISARKYLPESSRSVLAAFQSYLDGVCKDCRRRADPRLAQIVTLMERLRDCDRLVVMTAGCQRDSFEPIEELPLIDQEREPRAMQPDAVKKTRLLTGEVTLSPVEHKDLFRTVLILDAVVRGWDKSGASLRAWRNLRKQPLKTEVGNTPERFPELRGLILGNKLGVQIDIDRLARIIHQEVERSGKVRNGSALTRL